MLNIFRLLLVGLLFLFADSVWAKSSTTTRILNKDSAYKATLKISDTFVKLIHPAKTLSAELDNEMLEGKASTRVMDMNFDGIDDVAVMTGIGYSGVNQFYTLWLSTDNTYKEYKDTLSNIEVDAVKQLLFAEYKSGPSHFNEIYRISDETGDGIKTLNLYATYEHYAEDDLCVLKREEVAVSHTAVSCSALINHQQHVPVFASVKTSKAYLYDTRDSDINNGMYLLKGDTVEIVAYDGYDLKVLVGYEGKKHIEKYMDYGQLQILAPLPLKEYVHKHMISIFAAGERSRGAIEDSLLVRPVTEKLAYYSIQTFVRNANMCDFSGAAKRVNNVLTATLVSGCTIEFREQGNKVTLVDVGLKCQKLCGHNATIDGVVFERVSTRKSRLQKALKAHISKGVSVLYQTFGDLNQDGYLDALVILKKNNEAELKESPSRPLLLFSGQSDGSFKLLKRNDNAVQCVRCGGPMGDPFSEVMINKGYFSLEYYGGSAWRWTQVVTFRYSRKDKNWLLHRSGGEYFNSFKPDKIKKYMKTKKDFGRVTFDEFDLDNVELE